MTEFSFFWVNYPFNVKKDSASYKNIFFKLVDQNITLSVCFHNYSLLCFHGISCLLMDSNVFLAAH